MKVLKVTGLDCIVFAERVFSNVMLLSQYLSASTNLRADRIGFRELSRIVLCIESTNLDF
ncbi:hypothetical protein D3261_16150 [Halococcus sp. IIIV-5B]|nr:hypothetical protein D3261_16150 [Halococcus sp. IIIV-5B]